MDAVSHAHRHANSDTRRTHQNLHSIPVGALGLSLSLFFAISNRASGLRSHSPRSSPAAIRLALAWQAS
jgi:hypothetical protein